MELTIGKAGVRNREQAWHVPSVVFREGNGQRGGWESEAVALSHIDMQVMLGPVDCPKALGNDLQICI